MYDERFFLTREMLYQKVWGTPATKLSKELGISDVMLGKICRKLDVQKPPLGYWRKLETSHKHENKHDRKFENL
jgi:hypothetical protein